MGNIEQVKVDNNEFQSTEERIQKYINELGDEYVVLNQLIYDINTYWNGNSGFEYKLQIKNIQNELGTILINLNKLKENIIGTKEIMNETDDETANALKEEVN